MLGPGMTAPYPVLRELTATLSPLTDQYKGYLGFTPAG